MIGQVWQDRYQIEKLLGRGGLGRVYRAVDLKLKRPVAIKVLTDIGDQDRFQAQFAHEAETLAKLNHPNIVSVYDCSEHGGQPYLVMELVDGAALLEVVAEKPLMPRQVRAVALQVCDAMAYAHEHGIIHRDLTLRNIMVVKEGHQDLCVKILDFGLAKLLGKDSRSSGRMMQGTPSCMSPEQVLGEKVDGRADIFSFGVGLYRMLTDHFPFEAEHPAALLYLIVHEPCPQIDASVPSELQALVHHCLEKAPEDRPGSFADLRIAFEGLQLGPKSADSNDTRIPARSTAASTPYRHNPYLNRVMIKDPNDFFGRDREIRKIYSRLDAPHPQSVSIVGDRRIGKSSLLNYIHHRRNRRRFMQNWTKTIFIYLDFQTRVDFDVPKFVEFLLGVLSFDHDDGRASRVTEYSLEQLRNVAQALHNQGKRIIILMDEFEIITRNERFGADFFSFLRSLANSYQVAYVTSSRDDLQLMCHNKDISDSPFFNIFSSLPLRPFRREEAVALITEPSAREKVPLAQHADRILQLAGRFPLYLQIACSSAFEHLANSPGRKPDWEKIRATFRQEVLPHYRFLWDSMERKEVEVLSCLVNGNPISRKHAFVAENLLRRGYLDEDSGGPVLFSTSFREFGADQLDHGPGRTDRERSLWARLVADRVRNRCP
jgi:serine/threonine protein kinase